MPPLHVTFVDHGGQTGGGQLGLARYLVASRHHEVDAVLFSQSAAFDEPITAGTRINLLTNQTGARSYPLSAWRLFRHLWKERPHLVVANSVRAACVLAFVPLARGTARVYYMRDDLNPERNSKRKLWVLGHIVLPRYSAFIANSHWTASTLPKQLQPRPMQIAYPVSGLRPASHRPRTSPLRVLSLSRIAPWKGIHLLLEAVRRLELRQTKPLMEVTIAGGVSQADQTYLDELMATAATMSTPVNFMGHIDNPKSVLERAHCLVAVSETPEPFGQVISQGMSAGLVVIAGDAGGAREQISDGENGLLVTPADADALAHALEWVLAADDQTFDGLQAAAVASSERFADIRTVDQMDQALEQSAVALGVTLGVGRSADDD